MSAPVYNKGGERCSFYPQGLLGQRGFQCQVRAGPSYKASLNIESYFHVNIISPWPLMLSVEPRINHWQYDHIGKDKRERSERKKEEKRRKNRQKGGGKEGRTEERQGERKI